MRRKNVQTMPRPDVKLALELIGTLLEDYNDDLPHSDIKMRLPRRFIDAQTATP